MNNVQAYINNLSAPKTIDELHHFIKNRGFYNVEELINGTELEWTAPFWAKPGDIVFFMHSKTSRSSLSAMKTELLSNKEQYNELQFNELLSWIKRGYDLHKKYGGKIFAVARISDFPDYENSNNTITHWSSRIYAEIEEVCVLNCPIDIAEFNDKILVSRQSGITPILGEDFDYLKSLITNKNSVPTYFVGSMATPLPLAKINADNWMELSNEYRRAFTLEIQFRTYYVNYLLKSISDIKTIYRECRCKKDGVPDSFVDNVILFGGKYLPIEVKLSVSCERDINNQANKYCYTNYIIIDNKANRKVCGEQVIQNKILVIDTEQIYIYNADVDILTRIFDLDMLNSQSDCGELIALIRESL